MSESGSGGRLRPYQGEGRLAMALGVSIDVLAGLAESPKKRKGE